MLDLTAAFDNIGLDHNIQSNPIQLYFRHKPIEHKNKQNSKKVKSKKWKGALSSITSAGFGILFYLYRCRFSLFPRDTDTCFSSHKVLCGAVPQG